MIESDSEINFENENKVNSSQNKLLSFNNLLINLTEVNNNVLKSLIDTGSSLSLVKQHILENLERNFEYKKKVAPSLAKPIEGNLIALQYKVLLEFRLNDRIVKHYFYVFEVKDDSFPADILLGCDILKNVLF